MHLPVDVDSSRAVEMQSLATTTSALRQVELICPGPESLGVAGLAAGTSQRVDVLAATAPAQALPAASTGAARTSATSTGTFTAMTLPRGSGTWAAATTRGASVAASVAKAASVQLTGTLGLAPAASAIQRSVVAAGNDRAMVTSACAGPASQSWLLAGGAEPGRRERLVLTNPGPNPVTADVLVLGAAGPVSSPNGRGLIVPGYGRSVVLLDAIAGAEKSPVVHVVAGGGQLATALNDAWLDGVVPRGGDDITPVSGPAREQVVAGVAVQGRALVRVAVPGSEEAVVQIRVLTPRGPQALPRDGVVRVAGQSVRDVDLSGLTTDAYAVQVRADAPVVAGALTERRQTGAGPSDIAWSGASAAVTGVAGTPLPGSGTAGLTSTLHLVATRGDAAVRVTTVPARGAPSTRQVAVPSDSVLTVPLGQATSVWVTAVAGSARAAVVSSLATPQGPLLSATPLPDLPLTARHAALVPLP